MVSVITGLLSLQGCVEWLEVDDEGGEETLRLPAGQPVVLPSTGPVVGGDGPLIPQTPGLRVPLAGYWTRARLDTLDLLLPFTWASLLEAAEGPGAGAGPARPRELLLRIEASVETTDETLPVVGMRAIIPIALPPGTDATAVHSGFEVGRDGLDRATIALRTSAQDLWMVTGTRLRLETLAPRILVGTLEGEARRGAQGQRERDFKAVFVALRALP